MTDNVMKFTVRTLANQMNEELISEMQKYLHRGPLINRWNYVLASMGALPIAMHARNYERNMYMLVKLHVYLFALVQMVLQLLLLDRVVHCVMLLLLIVLLVM